MPRRKAKCPNPNSNTPKKTANNLSTSKTGDSAGNLEVKTELRQIELRAVGSLPDLNKYKYEKKPHVKIEYEETSSKKEGSGLWEPTNWRDFLLNLRIMRANNDAPVDAMGCHKSMDENAPPEVYRYQCLISLMLSSQTKDQVTFAAMERLRARGLTVDNILKMDDEELGLLIYPVGFWKTKVKYIKKTTQTLKEQYNSDIPDSVEKLCKLTGVGPKMAHICMKVAWDKVTGIGVDTHVHRISNRIGWVRKTTSTPEDTRKALQSWLPYDLWSEVNHLMVGFGQTICLPIGPNCHECLNNDICPSSGLGKKSPKKTDVLDKKSTVKKLTPKKEQIEEQDNEISDFSVNNSNVLSIGVRNAPVKSPRKRKITPNKVEKRDNCLEQQNSEISDFIVDNANLLNIGVKNAPEKSPRKKKTTPNKLKKEKNLLKKQDIETDDEFNFDNSNLLNIGVKTGVGKSPRKRKTNPNKIKKESNIDTDLRDHVGKAKKTEKLPQVKKVPPKKSSATEKGPNLDNLEVTSQKSKLVISPRVTRMKTKNLTIYKKDC